MAGFKREQIFPENQDFKNPGDMVEGIVTGVEKGKTEHGEAKFCILDDEGVIRSFCISSALDHYKWEERIGQTVQVEYLGELPSKKRQDKTYKNFDVRVWQD